MLVSMEMNRFGHIEVWRGRKTNREGDLYFQFQEEIERLIAGVPKRHHRDLDNGWLVRCHVSHEALGLSEPEAL